LYFFGNVLGNFLNFFEFFGNLSGGLFWRYILAEFIGRNFLGGFLGGFFGRNSLGGILCFNWY
jgi:hypothetical protein